MPKWSKFGLVLVLATVIVGSGVVFFIRSNHQDRERELAESWAQLEPTLTGQVGIVVMPVGGPSEKMRRFGPAPGGMAWSTAKVPIAMAAEMARPDSASVDAEIHSAITVSDNDAAASLWSRLGESEQARNNVDALLAQTGDTRTHIGIHETLGRTYTGYTTWRLEDQALFTSGVACAPSARHVLDEMKAISAEHRWGLGRVDGAAFKGGWGSYQGQYTSRQLGLVPIEGELGDPEARALVVTMTVENPEGDGRADLDKMAAWVQSNAELFEAGSCRR